MAHSIINVSVRRGLRAPDQLEFTARRVWLHGGKTHERVILEGSVPALEGESTAELSLLAVFEAAAALLKLAGERQDP